jgi:MFS family permease
MKASIRSFLLQSLQRLKLFRALSHKPIRILWSGEAFSAVGDEIYKVALTWIAVGLIGAKAGYISAAQAGAVLVFGLLGGYWADRWDPRRTMLFSDIARGLIVMLPVIWAWFFPPNIMLLLMVAISISAFSAFFEPALQSLIPRLVQNRELLQATNGLMGTTNRLARAVGPSLVGALTGVIPVVQFFSLDALSFGCSAWAVIAIRRHLPESPRPLRTQSSLLDSILSGFRLTINDPTIRYVIWGKALTSGAWNLVLPLGIALLVEKMLPGNIRAYGFLLATYGVGNVSAAIVLSNLTIRHPKRVMGLGYAVLGLGFLGLAVMPTLPWMMAFAAFAAIGGPMNDLAHIDILQSRFPPDRLAPVVRFRMAIEFGGMLLFMLIAPSLFSWFGPRFTVGFGGLVNLAVGLGGIARFGEKRSPSPGVY